MTEVINPIADNANLRSEVLETAKTYVCQDRQNTHGNPEDTFTTHAALWSAYLSSKLNQPVELSPSDVAQMMVLFKVGRSVQNPLHMDNYIDSAGYSACAAELARN